MVQLRHDLEIASTSNQELRCEATQLQEALDDANTKALGRRDQMSAGDSDELPNDTVNELKQQLAQVAPVPVPHGSA